MKKLIFFILLGTFIVTVQVQDTDQKSRSYRMDFIFTGEVRNQADSTFVLQYSFSQENIKNYRALMLETDKGRQRVDLSVKTGQVGQVVKKGMEIKTGQGQVYMLIHDYDKYDLPVPVQAEDKQGALHPLYLYVRRGGYMTAGQLKAQIKEIREAAKEHMTGDTKSRQNP